MKYPGKLLAFSALVMESMAGYSSSLADCELFAALFANTCSSTTSTVDLTSVASSTFTCNSDVGLCAAGTTSSCAWSRQLCVTCSEINSEVYIRVQSNGMPNHCYYVSLFEPSAQSVDFSVLWQWDVGSTVYHTPSTQR